MGSTLALNGVPYRIVGVAPRGFRGMALSGDPDLFMPLTSRDLLGTYLCAGVFTMLLWQVFQNVGMTIGIMPVTGLPMPFISYGGSSLLTYFAMLGIVQSVHMRRMR